MEGNPFEIAALWRGILGKKKIENSRAKFSVKAHQSGERKKRQRQSCAGLIIHKQTVATLNLDL